MSPQNSLYDAAVIGGGIAGACAALALRQGGCTVALLEAGAVPRHKVCGEFFSGEISPIFARLGLSARLADAPRQTVTHAQFIAPSGRSVRLRAPVGAFALSRHALDLLLWEAARDAGADCRACCRILDAGQVSPQAGYALRTSGGEIRARAVLVSTGRNGLMALNGRRHREADIEPRVAALPSTMPPRYMGLKAHFRGAAVPSGVVEMHGFLGGYCGLTRVENGLVNACLLLRPDALGKQAPEAFLRALLGEHPQLRARLGGAERVTPWLATANLRFGLRRPVMDEDSSSIDAPVDVLCCGDAAGYIPPLVGDGMSMAARSGELAGQILTRQLRGEFQAQEAARRYQAAWHREFARRLYWADRMQGVGLQNQGAEWFVALLRLLPGLSELAVRLTRG